MIQTLGMSLAAALLFAIATGSANAKNKSKGTDLSPWTVTHADNARSQKKPGALKAKNAKAKISGEVFVKLPPGGRHSKGGPNLKPKDLRFQLGDVLATS
jgi:hypothetical protein